jgi:thiamine biosynthesis lipoprotein
MIHRAACYAMGTRFEIVLGGSDPARLQTIAQHILSEITHWHDRLSLFKRDSFLSFLNERAHAAPVPLEPDLYHLLSVCTCVHADSDGAFDPTVGGLMAGLGLHEESTAPARSISTGGPAPGMGAVELDHERRTVRFTRPGIALDLGSVAKGFALDLAAAHLRSFGIQHAMVHGGTSSIVAMGSASESESDAGWRIALGPGEDALVLTLCDGALSFSAPHGRSVAGPDGRSRITHIIDPRTGTPASDVVFAAAVASAITGNAVDPWPATRCEAWSTALVVLGRRPASMPDTLTSVLAFGEPGGPDRQKREVGEVERRWSVEGPHRPFIATPSPPKPRVPSGPRFEGSKE